MRPRLQRLKDPRLAAGIVLILACAIIGGYVLSGPQTVRVYRATAAVLPGTPVAKAPLEAVEISPQVAGAYLQTAGAGTIGIPIAAGELVPQSALEEVPRAAHVVLPLAISPAGVIAPGDRIEIWQMRPPGVTNTGPGNNFGEAVAEPRLVCRDARLVAVREASMQAAPEVEVYIPLADIPPVLRALNTGANFVILSPQGEPVSMPKDAVDSEPRNADAAGANEAAGADDAAGTNEAAGADDTAGAAGPNEALVGAENREE
ncbi:hypothetical protein ACU19_06885 [Actinobaculum suis]|uniref:hypothetical protein n=1 Tax=Actinobaculum suis TaxID=1657 RepID=UPI00066FE2AE|nr:hypothetical protein [Actinobaculum suis]KMY22985.1 hypothetical protein ACU19_06885 [Actinobaculum suis]